MWIVTLVLVLVTSPAFAQLQVDSAGRVGLGTTAPATRLHVIDTGTPLGSAGIDGQLIIQNSGTVGDGGVLSLIGDFQPPYRFAITHQIDISERSRCMRPVGSRRLASTTVQRRNTLKQLEIREDYNLP
jgi:hypothetical protein